MANSVDPDQTAPIGAVCSGSTLFASILNSSVMLGNYLQQTTSADDIFRCIFFSWRFKGYLSHSIPLTPIPPMWLRAAVCSKVAIHCLALLQSYGEDLFGIVIVPCYIKDIGTTGKNSK